MNYVEEIIKIIRCLGPGREYIARFLYIALLEMLDQEARESNDAA